MQEGSSNIFCNVLRLLCILHGECAVATRWRRIANAVLLQWILTQIPLHLLLLRFPWRMHKAIIFQLTLLFIKVVKPYLLPFSLQVQLLYLFSTWKSALPFLFPLGLWLMLHTNVTESFVRVSTPRWTRTPPPFSFHDTCTLLLATRGEKVQRNQNKDLSNDLFLGFFLLITPPLPINPEEFQHHS